MEQAHLIDSMLLIAFVYLFALRCCGQAVGDISHAVRFRLFLQQLE
jgi:hypothetical protein